jgi:peroxiredoxin
MRRYERFAGPIVVVLGIGLACAGCRPSGSTDGKGPKAADGKAGKTAATIAPKTSSTDGGADESGKAQPGPATSGNPATLAKPAKPTTLAKPTKPPEVFLTAQMAATCLVKVGDTMPDATLPDLDGKKASLRSLLGSKLTVVLFWTAANPYAVAAVRDLAQDVAAAYQGKGAAIVGICVKDKPDDAKKAVQEAGAKFPNLVDADGAFFAKVAKVGPDDKRPRVFLLDASGKIRWLDTEFSDTTKSQLRAWLDFELAPK